MSFDEFERGHWSMARLITECGHGEDVLDQLDVLWGKSAEKAGGQVNLLLSHLLDTAAVADRMWQDYLAPRTRRLLDGLSGGHGRRLFMWLCALHDCGKATPAFQAVNKPMAARVRAAGLGWTAARITNSGWRHDRAGGLVLRQVLRSVWHGGQIGWVWPLVAGHHGSFPSAAVFDSSAAHGDPHGRGSGWRRVQHAIVEVVTRAVGFPDLASVEPLATPSKAEQLVLSGLIVMADWIASDERFFTGVDTLDQVSLTEARRRADHAWQQLGLRGGWGELVVPDGDVFRRRFDTLPRASQTMVMRAARAMSAPGLMIVEAPMGEGKTKAALAAAEILAARFGADGVFVGMPTQATSDPMFAQVRAWTNAVDEAVASQVALLHGKRMVNPLWRSLLATAPDTPDDLYGSVDEDPYGVPNTDCGERHAPAEWFLGRKRGLLAASAVGTIDQLLHAATRTRHVMLRFAGLASKIVILDEVHAADIYMEQFLTEALRWLGQAGVAVILLSATVTPRQRQALVDAYLSGTLNGADGQVGELPPAGGYPCLTTACAVAGRAEVGADHVSPWRVSSRVTVEALQDISDDPTPVVAALAEALGEGGTALVIRNTVARAQDNFDALRAVFGEQTVLLHGRLCAADRAERTEQCLDLLGPSPSQPRTRRIVVATQLAEQSFDIDADLLITDLAPIDLLLQRIGRLHRHEDTVRPPHLSTPRVIVTGLAAAESGARFPSSCETIYGRHRLLRAAALVLDAVTHGWSIPDQVPALVAAGYADQALGPAQWAAEMATAAQEWTATQTARAASAEPFLLARRDEQGKPTLAGLHYGGSHHVRSEEELNALVRDGEPSTEVIIVRRRRGGYAAIHGAWLGQHGEAAPDVLDDVLAGATRLPVSLTAAADAELRPLDGWAGHPWLRHSRALVLEESGHRRLGRHDLRYDEALGLVIHRT